jgi:glycosyltransferase involved in cell wall biosynthesis
MSDGSTGTWSLAMIVGNEEATIRLVLTDAASICDELVVVDTGSTDATIEIARECGAQVYEFEWIDNFSAARNYSFDCCTGDWILWLDADDRITPSALEGFASLKRRLKSEEEINGVMIP